MCLHYSKAVWLVTGGSHLLSLRVTEYITPCYQAGRAQQEVRPALFHRCCSALDQTRRGREVFTQAPLCRCVWFGPSQAGWFVSVLNSRALGGLTTELRLVSLPDTPARRAEFTHATGPGCFTFERLQPPDKPEGTTVCIEDLRKLESNKINLFFWGQGTIL